MRHDWALDSQLSVLFLFNDHPKNDGKIYAELVEILVYSYFWIAPERDWDYF